MKPSDILYIHYYHKKIINKLLVIGFIRRLFKFKLFLYIYITPVGKGEVTCR